MTIDVVLDDPTDNRIIECAVESGSKKIITHDNDLLRVKEYEVIETIKAGAFLHRLEERELSRKAEFIIRTHDPRVLGGLQRSQHGAIFDVHPERVNLGAGDNRAMAGC